MFKLSFGNKCRFQMMLMQKLMCINENTTQMCYKKLPAQNGQKNQYTFDNICQIDDTFYLHGCVHLDIKFALNSRRDGMLVAYINCKEHSRKAWSKNKEDYLR